MGTIKNENVVWADPSPLREWWENTMFGTTNPTEAAVTKPTAGDASMSRRAVAAAPQRRRHAQRPRRPQ